METPLVVGASAAGNIASGARQEVVLRVLAARFGGRVLGGVAEVAVAEAGVADAGAAGAGAAGAGAAEAGAVGTAPLVVVTDDHTDLSAPEVRELVTRATAVVHTGIPRPARRRHAGLAGADLRRRSGERDRSGGGPRGPLTRAPRRSGTGWCRHSDTNPSRCSTFGVLE